MQFCGGFERICYPYPRYFEHTVHILHITFDIGCQIFGRLYAARIQRAGKCAGQSPRDSRHHVIEGGRVIGSFQLFTVFVLVKIPDAAVDAEMDGLVKAFQVGCSMGPLVLLDVEGTGVGDCHGNTSFVKL
jgi:hypothetical protein